MFSLITYSTVTYTLMYLITIAQPICDT